MAGRKTTLPQEERLRRALSLGLRPISSTTATSHDRRKKIWRNTDAEVQGQAIRAIQAFVNVHKSSLPSFEKSLVDDIVSALEGLLMAGTEPVYHAAAEGTLALITIHGSSGFRFGIQGLVAPLMHLLACSRNGTVAVCATALRFIIGAPKARSWIKEEELIRLLKDADVTSTLGSMIKQHGRFDNDGISLYVALLDLLCSILQRWPLTRFGVGHNSDFLKLVLRQTLHANDEVTCAALRLSSALALCGGVALLQIQEKEDLSNCLVVNTNCSRTFTTRAEAFRFLTLLSRSPTLSTSIIPSKLDSICKNTADAIAEGLLVHSWKWPPDLKMLVVEASGAARGLLKVAGNHHQAFWKMGFPHALCNLLWGLYDDRGVSNMVGRTQKMDKYNFEKIDLRPCLWDALGLLAIHARSYIKEILTSTKQQKASVTRIICFGCAQLLKVVDRRSLQADEQCSKGASLASLESAAICKAVLFLLFSPSFSLSGIAKHHLENSLQKHGLDWLPSFVSKLSLTFSSVAASEGTITITNLMALCSLSKSGCCHDGLVEEGVLEILVKAIKAHSLANCSMRTCSTTGLLYTPEVSFCCWSRVNAWEGEDPILLFSLWAFSSLARGSDIAKAANIGLKKRFQNHLEWIDMPNEELESHLLMLASSRSAAAGIRWWASYCLACCGAYGFPAERNGLSKLYGDAFWADIKMVFCGGSHVYAHKVIVFTRCPNLMPASLKDEIAVQDGDHMTMDNKLKPSSCHTELHFSARVHEAPMVALLEFIYKGFVLLEEELVAEVKTIAKRCHMDAFSRLLEGIVPIWDTFPNACDFSLALDNAGCSFSDILLEDREGYQAGCIATAGDVSHQHAHRAVLSSQCSYFEGLFRSGMQDSVSEVVKLSLSVEATRRFLHYMYSMSLPRIELPEAGCMWSWNDKLEQIKHLEPYVELAQVAEQWLLEDLKKQCLNVIQSHLKVSTNLGPEIMKLAALYQQWELVVLVADGISMEYTRMRDNGELDSLDEYLVDAIRTAHVQKFMSR